MPIGAANVPWGPVLTRLNPWYPGQMGVPGTDNETGLRLDTNGAIFYVDPNAVGVSDQRDGTDPTEPLRTVAAALTHCQAYRNDVIVVAPNSEWDYASPVAARHTPIQEEITVSVDGVRIVGLYPSSCLGVPWHPLTDNGVCITVNAMDVLIEGFCFYNADGVTAPTGVLAQWDGPPWGENLTVRHCYFDPGMGYGVRLDYTWNCHIYHNNFQEVTAAAIDCPAVYGQPDYTVIHDNLFMHNTLAISLPATSEMMIYRNYIIGAAGGTNNFINLTGGVANLVADNWLGCTLAGGQYNTTCSDAASGAWIRNHCIDGETGAAPT